MKIVNCSCLGSLGRFGNQCFQYSCARKYAEIAKATLHTPDWLGTKLFGIHHPRIARQLPKTPSDSIVWGRPNVDLYGYFQYQDVVGKLKRSELKSWFNFLPEFKDRFPKKDSYIAAHCRRGDYLTTASHVYCNITEQSYYNACDKFGLDRSKLVFVKEDEPQVDSGLSGDLAFLPDFFTLMNADVILRANSSFSWWAAVLGNGKVYSPIVEAKTGPNDVEFVEGNWPRMCDRQNCGGNVTDLYLPE